VASSAWVLAQLGEASEALNQLREGEQLVEHQAARGAVVRLGWVYHARGRACLLLRRLDEARRLGNRAVESSPRQPGFAAHAQHLLGDVATHPDRFDADRGEAHYRQALALAEPRSMRPLVAHCHLGLGKLSRRTGKRRDAQEHLTTATTMYREMTCASGWSRPRRRSWGSSNSAGTATFWWTRSSRGTTSCFRSDLGLLPEALQDAVRRPSWSSWTCCDGSGWDKIGP
jgi:tetratricopeptide (TPR) repeat protein